MLQSAMGLYKLMRNITVIITGTTSECGMILFLVQGELECSEKRKRESEFL